MFSKIEVNGEGACELYQLLKREQPGEADSSDITWNFEKFLVGRDGTVVRRFPPMTTPEEIGEVLEVKDGIARIYGLTETMASEMLEITAAETGETVTGLALNLEEDNIGAVILGDWGALHEGDQVRRTGRVLDIPVGPGFLGRVVDPLGQPIDGKGPIQSTERRQIDIVAPGIVLRQPVKEPMQTGIKAIDALIPIGRGRSRPSCT